MNNPSVQIDRSIYPSKVSQVNKKGATVRDSDPIKAEPLVDSQAAHTSDMNDLGVVSADDEPEPNLAIKKAPLPLRQELIEIESDDEVEVYQPPLTRYPTKLRSPSRTRRAFVRVKTKPRPDPTLGAIEPDLDHGVSDSSDSEEDMDIKPDPTREKRSPL